MTTRKQFADRFFAVFALVFAAFPVLADISSSKPRELVGPKLGAASNFGHGTSEEVLEQAIRLGVSDFRDIVYWSVVEQEPGEFSYEEASANYPALIKDNGGQMSLTVNWGNELYDKGHTPFSAEGREALGRFITSTLREFPAIEAVEVGNEFNGNNFIVGPLLETRREARAAAHLELLQDVYRTVKAEFSEVQVLGGAAHSVPGGYVWPIFDLGGAAYMDALVLHPYTTSPEQLVRQINVLRRNAAVADIPIHVTEFGEKDDQTAPGYLLRMYCAMALSGVERAVWYPLNERGDDLEPLIDPISGRSTRVGLAFAQVQDKLMGLPVRDISPDPFTYACQFGEKAIVIWGEQRSVAISQGMTALNAEGVLLDPVALRMTMTNPILITSDEPFQLGEDVTLSRHDILADSFHQFSYPKQGHKKARSDAFERFAQRAGRRVNLKTMPGQEAAGTPWTPYLGNRYLRPARITAKHLVPGKIDDEEIEIVHRYVAKEDLRLSVDAVWEPGAESADGIAVTVMQDDTELFSDSSVRQTQNFTAEVLLPKDAALEFIVGPGGDAKGDVTEFRIVLRAVD